MTLHEETVKQNVVFRGKILSVRCDDARLPDGRMCTREVVEHRGGACVLAEREGKIVLVRQFRYAYGEELLEIPAGKLEAGEDPALTAGRELEEEVGLIADRLELLFTLYPTPGYSNEKIYIYRAFGLREGNRHLDDGEFVDVVWLPAEEVLGMIEKGAIRDAKTIAAVQHYFLHAPASTPSPAPAP